MKCLWLCLVLLVSSCSSPGVYAMFESGELYESDGQTVVLLHGLARTHGSMSRLAKRLHQDGFRVCNIGYPSRSHTVEKLAAKYVWPDILQCLDERDAPVHFVTHSMGGILVRQLSQSQRELKIGRVVMLGPPNGGSEVVDALGDWWLFGKINGPAGKQLGTRTHDLPKQLGMADFELGVIAGNRSVNWILSSLISGADDGKVSVENAKLKGMTDFLIVPHTHPFMMKRNAVAEQAIYFLKHGKFKH